MEGSRQSESKHVGATPPIYNIPPTFSKRLLQGDIQHGFANSEDYSYDLCHYRDMTDMQSLAQPPTTNV